MFYLSVSMPQLIITSLIVIFLLALIRREINKARAPHADEIHRGTHLSESQYNSAIRYWKIGVVISIVVIAFTSIGFGSQHNPNDSKKFDSIPPASVQQKVESSRPTAKSTAVQFNNTIKE